MRKALVIGVLGALGALGAGVATPAGARKAKAPRPCAPWRTHVLLHGQGWLENLAFDGRGGLTISALAGGKLLRLNRRGKLTTLLSPVSAPGGQRRRGRYLYFNTGDTLPLTPTGTLDRLDLRTGKRRTVATGLTMPNGLALLPNGDAVVSRDIGSGTGLTRIRARDPKHPQFNWAKLDDTNGLSVDPTGRYLYVARTFSPDGEITRVSIRHPARVRAIGHLGAGVLPDDLTTDRKGVLYVAGFAAGKVYRLNPRTGRSCAIASGLTSPTSPRFGGAGWGHKRLYVTTSGGDLVELIPPAAR